LGHGNKKNDDEVSIVVFMHSDGLITVYASIYGIEVCKDDFVKKGQKIAV